SPFIFANFNGTSGDVDVLTHEVGHAFAAHLAWDIEPAILQVATLETCEIHATALEYLTWPWMEGFFGVQTDKYYESHLTVALSFLPYGAMVDEYQHHIYENPEMTPAQRNEYWLTLESKYRPWLDLTDTPYHGEGRQWQSIAHIYEDPFYYIDYCLSFIVALGFWAESQEDAKAAWAKYRKLTALAGTKTFVELIAEAGLPTPFETDNIKVVADAAIAWLDKRK
ncbi:MAG: M3 family metallopeptidase, partial [Defluviitaleaceae bacterium]|nr:M3 family metallopeptidase [Defluviitaleaceae bacterium]